MTVPATGMFTARYGVDRWVLDGHRTKAGQALIPGTAYLELAAEALAAEGIAQFDIRDLTFFRALDVPDTTPRDIRATLSRSDEGYGFTLSSAVQVQGRTGWQMNAQARLIPTAAKPGTIDPAEIAASLPAGHGGCGRSAVAAGSTFDLWPTLARAEPCRAGPR